MGERGILVFFLVPPRVFCLIILLNVCGPKWLVSLWCYLATRLVVVG